MFNSEGLVYNAQEDEQCSCRKTGMSLTTTHMYAKSDILLLPLQKQLSNEKLISFYTSMNN